MNGTPVGRNWVVMMQNGITAIDWDGGMFQDAISGEFFKVTESTICFPASNADLDWLQRSGCILGYDETYVYFTNLPDLPLRPQP
jgi:hypothetical protein